MLDRGSPLRLPSVLKSISSPSLNYVASILVILAPKFIHVSMCAPPYWIAIQLYSHHCHWIPSCEDTFPLSLFHSFFSSFLSCLFFSLTLSPPRPFTPLPSLLLSFSPSLLLPIPPPLPCSQRTTTHTYTAFPAIFFSDPHLIRFHSRCFLFCFFFLCSLSPSLRKAVHPPSYPLIHRLLFLALLSQYYHQGESSRHMQRRIPSPSTNKIKLSVTRSTSNLAVVGSPFLASQWPSYFYANIC